jgi:hypothetical protein
VSFSTWLNHLVLVFPVDFFPFPKNYCVLQTLVFVVSDAFIFRFYKMGVCAWIVVLGVVGIIIYIIILLRVDCDLGLAWATKFGKSISESLFQPV